MNDKQLKRDEILYSNWGKNGILKQTSQEHSEYSAPDNLILVIPPNTFLRKDKTQIVFYGREFLGSWCNRLTPGQAAVIALMDGERTLGDISNLLRQYSGGSKELNDFKVRKVLAFIDAFDPKHRKITKRETVSSFKKYNPKDFFIPDKKVKLNVRLDKPVSMLLMPTSICQTNCVYCYATRSEIPQSNLLSDERIKELFDEAAEMGVFQINVDGGDALCRKNITKLIAHASSLNIQIDISTKAYISPCMAKELYDAGIKIIQFGFDAPYPELFDKVVGRKGHFYKTIESIHNCVNAGIQARTNSIIIRDTYQHINELISLLYTLPLMDMKIASAFRSAHRYKEGLLLSEKQKQWLREQIRIQQEKHPDGKIKFECQSDYLDMDDSAKNEAFINYPRCGIVSESIVIAPDGRVVMCEQSPHSQDLTVGNVKNSSLLEVWQSEEMKSFINVNREQFKGTVCYDCKDFKNCFQEKGGCFILSVKAYGTRFAPHPACPKAPKYKIPIQ